MNSVPKIIEQNEFLFCFSPHRLPVYFSSLLNKLPVVREAVIAQREKRAGFDEEKREAKLRLS